MGITHAMRALGGPMRRLMVILAVALLMPVASVAASTSPVGAAPAPVVDKETRARLAATAPTSKLVAFVHGSTAAAATRAVAKSGMKLAETFSKVRVAVGAGTPGAILLAATQPGVTRIELDEPLAYDLDTAHVATRTAEVLGNPDRYHDASGAPLDGRGITIGIVDSGVDSTHPMFQGPDGTSRVIRNLRLACHDVVCMGTAPDSLFVQMADTDSPTGGHGTHVAGIAGGGYVETLDGIRLNGSGPGSKMIMIANGAGLSIYGATSSLNWFLEHHDKPCQGSDGTWYSHPVDCPPVRVVSNSYSGPRDQYDPDSVAAKLHNALVASGVVLTFSAGNGDQVTNDGGDGSDNRVNLRGPTPGVIVVANYDDADSGNRDNQLDPSSSRGRNGWLLSYPDLSAPGTDILSACRPTLPICNSLNLDQNYGSISGTSMATPMVAGVVAAMLQANPTLTPAQVEDILEDTAYKFSFGAAYEPDDPAYNDDNTTSFDKGHGLLDAARAVSEAMQLDDPGQPLPVCSGGDVVVRDPAGDATELLLQGEVAPSEPGLDVIDGSISWDPSEGATGTLTFVIEVADLTETPPTASVGEYFDFNFTYEGADYFVSASRSRVEGEGYDLGVYGATGRDGLADLTGSFDNETDLVTIKLPAEAIAGPADDPPGIAEGSLLTGIGIVSRREVVVVVPNADTAPGACPYTVGLGAVPPAPGPDPGPGPGGAEATLTAGDSYAWSAGPFTDALSALAGPDSHLIELVVPAGGATFAVSIGSDDPTADFDLYVYGPDGQQIDESANEGSAESLTVPVSDSGVYTVEVAPFLAVEATYSGTASLS